MMGSLLRWETRQTLTSKSFWIIGASLVVFPALLLAISLYYGGFDSGYEGFLEGLNNYNAFVIFLIGVFAGIHVTGAFEGRKIQAAIMAGNSRLKILMAKFLSFAGSVTLFSVAGITVSSLVAFKMLGINGLDGSFARVIIGRSLVFIVTEVAYASVCFLASMFIRHLGGSIGLNLGLMLMLNVTVQILMNFEWSEIFLKFIPAAQVMYVVADFSNKNIVMALVSSALALTAAAGVSYLKFAREELK